jgi:hypothetical protein
MARRVVMGRMSNGTYDVRISRKGFDAMTADVNNDHQISFSAQRTARAKVGAAGQISGQNNWVNFGRTFDNPPPTLAALKRGGRIYFDYYDYLPNPTGGNGVYYGTPFCLVVQQSRVRAIKCIDWTNYSIPSTDRYLFYTLVDE